MRAGTIRFGDVSFAISAIVVCSPWRDTYARSSSLSVISRQRVPPHHVPGSCFPAAVPEAAALAHSAADARSAIASTEWARRDRLADIGDSLGERQCRSGAHVSHPCPPPQPCGGLS